MLEMLRRLHDDILAKLDALEALTSLPQPPMDRLPALRQALTRSSRARTMLLERAYGQLIAECPPAKKAALEVLKTSGKDNLITSTQHIGSWTLRQIADRWPEYCAASTRMRADMRQRIRSEKDLIYPLLAEQKGG
ncbi:hypothetical protein [Sphingomonas asaccharolytica]|uniref:hypothetical protein n=1 Tax=Sphingomonas asaccharolytica TaxID=40681 RepID=UPI000A5BE0FD|nr:hypothetical protein [Sphingomonas asaccharolytica]